jgi:hypothetical protein
MEENDSKKLNKLNFLLYIAFALLFIVLSIYFFNFHANFSTDKGDWGAFGDFLGGTLNPLFALLSLFAILYTIKIQTQELQATKEELSKSRIAQEEQSKAFKTQNLSIKQQTFENTFFKMLELHNELIGELYQNSNELYEKIFTNRTNGKVSESFVEENKGIVKTSFMTLYQILKFIDDQNLKFENDAFFNPTLYSNIVRATFDDVLLCFLAINCNIEGFEKFKTLIEKYSFLEHLNIEHGLKEEHEWLVLDTLVSYNDHAFGNNEQLKSTLNQLKKSPARETEK